MADITITIPNEAIPRIKAFMDDLYPAPVDPATGLETPWTNADYLEFTKSMLIQYLKLQVRRFEERIALVEAREQIVDIDAL